jgi:hypothetical protein
VVLTAPWEPRFFVALAWPHSPARLLRLVPAETPALVRSMTRAPGRSRGAGHLDAVGLGGGFPMEPRAVR